MRLMKLSYLILLLLSSIAIASTPPIPGSLRGGINADQATIDTALAMQGQGWEYIMPQPKSKQARWDNNDGRTTWWIGYWKNSKTKQTSSRLPKLTGSTFTGDGQGSQSWRRGGSPGRPSKLEWLLSTHGGIQPR